MRTKWTHGYGCLIPLILMAAAVLFPVAAFAQDVTPENTAGAVMLAAYAVGTAVVVAAGGLLGWWLLQKAKSSQAMAVLQQLYLVAQSVVAHVEAKVRPEIRGAMADGVLTPEERKRIQTVALQAFKEAAGPALLAQAKKYFGAGGVDTLLSGILEWALKRFKGDATALVVPVAPASSSTAASP